MSLTLIIIMSKVSINTRDVIVSSLDIRDITVAANKLPENIAQALYNN